MYSEKTTATANRIKPATEFDTVNDALSYANLVAERAEALADALLGCEPASARIGLSSVSETPDGALPRLAMSAQHARNRLSDAMAALDRIQRALP